VSLPELPYSLMSPPQNLVGAAATLDMVVSSLANDVVVASPSEELIVTASAIEVILAAAAKQKVEPIEVVAVVRPRAFDPSKRPNPHGCKTSWRFRSVRKICADASKIVSCARFRGIRTLGRFESEEIAAKGCFDRGSRRPTTPRNRSGGSPSRPAARADAR
jgi:hypothetical protein